MSGTTGSDAGAASVLAFEDEPSVTTIERRGIEYIPPGKRWGKPGNLFWMWAGAVWNVEFVVYGGLAVVVFGLSFAQAVVIILIGNLSSTCSPAWPACRDRRRARPRSRSAGPRSGPTATGCPRCSTG
jgi:hypothetical protein